MRFLAPNLCGYVSEQFRSLFIASTKVNDRDRETLYTQNGLKSVKEYESEGSVFGYIMAQNLSMAIETFVQSQWIPMMKAIHSEENQKNIDDLSNIIQ